MAEELKFAGEPSSAVDGIGSYFSGATVNWGSFFEGLPVDSAGKRFIGAPARTAVLEVVSCSASRLECFLESCFSFDFKLDELHANCSDANVEEQDVFPDCLATAQDRVPSAEIAHGLAAEPPIVDCSVDVVATNNLLERVAEDNSGVRASDGVLTPGGVLVVAIPNSHAPYGHYDAHLSLGLSAGTHQTAAVLGP